VDPLNERLLTPREVARLFGVNTATIARRARDGRLTPLVTPGGHRRYTRTSLRRAHDRDRTVGVVDHAVGDRAEEQSVPRAQAS
jgi:predicted site-specific integrase-resolvase